MNWDDVKIKAQYLTPKHALSRLVGAFAAARAGWFTQLFIRWFIRQYKIDMSEAVHESPAAYKTFNDFFTRHLKPELRPLDASDPDQFAHPVDGAVSQLGDINDGRIFQAKGHDYSLTELLGGDPRDAHAFKNGKFATIYLAPKDYHRLHMPCDGTLRKMVYVPGDLFSVNPLTAANVPNLFARNERVVAIFDSEFGKFSMVLVGATIVASIGTVWAGTVTPPTGDHVHSWDYPASGDQAIRLKKGEEMGHFKLGSTVVLTFPEDTIDFDDALEAGSQTRMGQVLGQRDD
ncbi:Phosphatidylserine decarboxylase proenzyme [Pseudidiomarina piscicola]|uniref:Phosphatidylserine decarboxylase proenzyme n=1 Tax=Pseudidiomarina piscicola TaxID=2614830 RepID=A0A6Y9WJL7_9GAMM|nr:archaetidylserine decarboxylase [Pseudidiomarina piscicola]CAB0151765.1 Phosphatidylserine decarboxylase proenzyme [Pseudidiomarina piscicola]VZT41219.1 Phosphatidylserine decarboxylase proenzyme [Pseudomonas aeruginosa]